jgi:hypothetical protein
VATPPGVASAEQNLVDVNEGPAKRAGVQRKRVQGAGFIDKSGTFGPTNNFIRTDSASALPVT